LIHQAKQANSVATNMLLVEKEVGLLRYHGITGYFREKRALMPTWLVGDRNATGMEAEDGSRASHSASSSSSTSTTTLSTTARISFMITSSQRAELIKLEYTEQEIKRLKPLEASLILDHQLHPREAPERLPVLVQEYEEELVKAKIAALEQHKREEQERLQREQEAALEASQSDEVQEGQREQRNGTPSIRDEDLAVSETTREWFAVVETKPNGESTIVGLYTIHDEARICLETKEHIATKYSKSEKEQPTYEIQITKR
jgi:hypothetical protein